MTYLLNDVEQVCLSIALKTTQHLLVLWCVIILSFVFSGNGQDFKYVLRTELFEFLHT